MSVFKVCVCVCTAWGVQHKQWVAATWINASFGHKGTDLNQDNRGGLTERERERERNKERGLEGSRVKLRERG